MKGAAPLWMPMLNKNFDTLKKLSKLKLKAPSPFDIPWTIKEK